MIFVQTICKRAWIPGYFFVKIFVRKFLFIKIDENYFIYTKFLFGKFQAAYSKQKYTTGGYVNFNFRTIDTLTNDNLRHMSSR